MFLTNPLWLTALATLVTSIASFVWALRRKRLGNWPSTRGRGRPGQPHSA